MSRCTCVIVPLHERPSVCAVMKLTISFTVLGKITFLSCRLIPTYCYGVTGFIDSSVAIVAEVFWIRNTRLTELVYGEYLRKNIISYIFLIKFMLICFGFVKLSNHA